MSSAPVTRIERYAGWLCAHPWVVIIATALIAFTLVSGGSRLKTTNDFRAFFGPDNPELVELNCSNRPMSDSRTSCLLSSRNRIRFSL